MKRKRPYKIKKRTPVPATEIPIEMLQKRAFERLDSGSLKKAIIDLKELLQREYRPEWLDALAQAYSKRARELASKGMFKEALKIWRNRAEVCGKPMNDPRCLGVLLSIGNVSDVLEWLHEQLPSLAQDKNSMRTIRRICAAHALAGMETLVEPWPQDDQLRKDLPAAQRALEAYTSGDDILLQAALDSIPFRSPFRELKTIFKALAQLHDTPQTVAGVLAKIDKDSPFYILALAVNNAVSGQTAAIPYANRAVTEFTNSLKGWSQDTAATAKEFMQHKRRSTPVALLKTLYKRRAVLGFDFARQAAMRIVINDSVDSWEPIEVEFENTFGIPDQFERYRTTALMMELDNEPLSEILDEWRSTLRYVDDTKACAAEDKSIIKALILQRMADKIWKHPRYDNKESLDYLDKSIVLDPQNRESHILLIQRYRETDMLKDAKRVVTLAESHWPDEPRLLVESARNAIAAKAFKKATLIANRVLKLDPVNMDIKELLFDAHLAHARKQISGGKVKLADKELQQAEAWANSDHRLGRIELLRGISAFKQTQKAAAKQLISSGCSKLGVLKGRFLLIFEAMNFQLNAMTLLRNSRIRKRPDEMQPADMLELLPEIEPALADAGSNGSKAVKDFLPTLKAAAKLEYSNNELSRICELCCRYDMLRTTLLCPFARVAKKRWPQQLVFVFYCIEARRKPERPHTARDEQQLRRLIERAKMIGDSRTITLIETVLNRFPAYTPPFGFVNPFDAVEDTDIDLGGQLDLPLGANLDDMIKTLLSNPLPAEMEAIRAVLGEQAMLDMLKDMILSRGMPQDLDDEFF